MSRTPSLVNALPQADPGDGPPASRRRHQRVALDCPVALVNDADGSTRAASTLDISKAGVSLITDKPVTPGGKYQLTIDLACLGKSSKPLNIAAKAVYSSYSGPRRFRVGLLFMQPDAEAAAVLQDLLVS